MWLLQWLEVIRPLLFQCTCTSLSALWLGFNHFHSHKFAHPEFLHHLGNQPVFHWQINFTSQHHFIGGYSSALLGVAHMLSLAQTDSHPKHAGSQQCMLLLLWPECVHPFYLSIGLGKMSHCSGFLDTYQLTHGLEELGLTSMYLFSLSCSLL